MDEDIVQRIARDFSTSSFQSLRAIQVTAINGAIVLSGTTPNYHQRQLALKCAKDNLANYPAIQLIDRIKTRP